MLAGIWMLLQALPWSISKVSLRIRVSCWSSHRPSSWPSCQPWLRPLLGPLGQSTFTSLRRSLKDHFCPSIISLWWHLTLWLGLASWSSLRPSSSSFASVLMSHVAFSIPIVVLMVLPRLKEMNRDMVNAAYDLGATQVQMLKEIMLPYLTPAIIAGYFMAFTYSLDDFAVTFFVTGNGFTTLSVEIYSRARQGISLNINALSALVFLFSILLVVGYYFITREKEETVWKNSIHSC